MTQHILAASVGNIIPGDDAFNAGLAWLLLSWHYSPRWRS